MKKISILLLIITQTINLFSQQVDAIAVLHESQYKDSFLIILKDEKRKEWFSKYDDSLKQKGAEETNASDYNIQLKQLADSMMKRVFGEIGFSNNFTMTCLQNPCAIGYLYANTLVSTNPCATEPQDSCKEAIVTYSYVKNDVPLTLKMLITIKENGEIVYIENNTYGLKEISIEKQNLLTISEIQKIITKRFPKDSLVILADNKALVYAHRPIKQPQSKDVGNKLNRDPGYRLIKETRSGKNWENGFVYITQSRNPRKSKRIYHFDAVTGKLLSITEIYNVTNGNLSH
jgi:hypothetical protein